MRKITLVLLLTFSCFLIVNAQKGVVVKLKNDTWISYFAKNAGFKVMFPVKPIYIDVDTSTPPMKRTNHMYTALTNPIVYIVAFSDNPVLPERQKEDLNADYEFLKNNLNNFKGEIISEKVITLGNISGREITGKSKNIVVIDRLFLVNKKLYQVLVSIDEKDLKDEIVQKLVKRYFDSFTLLESKK